jgi:hypothetical protein
MALAGASSAAKPASGASTAPRAAGSHVGASLVRQVGARNYAGPNCPGVGWNCTTATRVLQIATDGGDNVAQCTTGTTSITDGSQSCTIEQHGSNNTARCFERSNTVPAATQICMITQTGAKNTAVVDQLIVQAPGTSQTGTQKATVNQGTALLGSTTGNDVQLSQSVKQNTGGVDDDAGSKSQNAYQSANVTQWAADAGKNQSQIDQSESQKAHGGSTQTQNRTPGSDDCAPSFGAFSPNICANVAQHSSSGTNANRLRQAIDERAKTNVIASQWQGWFSTGIDGKVHQDTVSGSSSNDANQSKVQEAFAPPTSFQQQMDPISCCGFASQDGGTGNQETITQSADLQATEGLASQTVDLEGTSNSLTGSCTFDQQASVNAGSDSNSGTVGPPCNFISASLDCASGNPPTDAFGGDFVVGDVVPQQDVEPPCIAVPPGNID